jgi:hypothetical protein
MRVDHAKVERASDQEDHRLVRLESRESASATFGGLKQAIERFEKSIGLPGLLVITGKPQRPHHHPTKQRASSTC